MRKGDHVASDEGLDQSFKGDERVAFALYGDDDLPGTMWVESCKDGGIKEDEDILDTEGLHLAGFVVLGAYRFDLERK